MICAAVSLTSCYWVGNTEAEQLLDGAVDVLDGSEQFTEVEGESSRYQGQMVLDGFDVVLAENADLEEVGELLTRIVEEYGVAPDIKVDETTTLGAFRRRPYEHAQLPPQGWTEALEIAQRTEAIEVTVWPSIDDEAVVTVRTWTPEFGEAFALLDEWKDYDTPTGAEQFNARIESGTSEAPLERSEDSPWLLVETVKVVGPIGPELAGFSDELMTAAEEVDQFEKIEGFEFTYVEELNGGDDPAVRPEVELYVFDDRTNYTSLDNWEVSEDFIEVGESYADSVEEILDAEVNVGVYLSHLNRHEVYVREYE